MHAGPPLDLSIIVPFTDHEELVGAACWRLARHIRELYLSFEIIAVDEGSGDNSPAILSLLRRQMPELRVTDAPAPGLGVAGGAGQARGRVLLLIRPEEAMQALAPVGRAFRRVFRGELELVIVEDRFALAHRTQLLPVVRGLRRLSLSRLARRARQRGLSVETYALGGSDARRAVRVGEGRLFRWLGAALRPARLAR